MKAVQKLKSGIGPTYHRTYCVKIPIPAEEMPRAKRLLERDLNAFSPQVLAIFKKIRGNQTHMRIGDEYMITIPGPWNGPVRVSAKDKSGFTLSTLEGHLEAGEIKFSLSPHKQFIELKIESYAKSGNFLVDLFYDKVPFVKAIQTRMWDSFCRNFSEAAVKECAHCNRKSKAVKVTTERLDSGTGQWENL